MYKGRVAALNLTIIALLALLAFEPVSARVLTSATSDPLGDPCCGAPAYAYTVEASITLKDGRFTSR